MRYFLIDKVTELVVGEKARGVKNVSLADEYLHDHFPDYPIMPGALIIEAIAQLAGFLLSVTVNQDDAPPRRALLVQVRQAKFHQLVGPGDQLDIEVKLVSLLSSAALVKAEALVGNRRAVRAELMFTLNEIPSERVHEQLRYLYRLWTRHFDPPLTIR
ncbi:MAG: 3-hydroxyacyl-ACP dehydratase FabZ family protein [Pseudomonadota bacterium]